MDNCGDYRLMDYLYGESEYDKKIKRFIEAMDILRMVNPSDFGFTVVRDTNNDTND